MNETFRLGRIAGIAVGVNWSVLFVVGLFAWSLAEVTLPDAAGGYTDAAYWTVGVAAALAFFACLLAHELAHSVVAVREGVEVDSITLWLLGGVSKLRGEAADPGAELRISVAGPATSIALGTVFLGAAAVFAGLGGPALGVAALAWLGTINGVLAIFNLVPAAPLDGGRILHALVWRRTNDHARATSVSTRAGRWFGAAMITFGLLLVLLGGLAGLWFVLLGWFLREAARAESTHELLHGALASVRVRDVMTADPVVVPADVLVADLVDEWFLGRRCSAFPVVVPDGTTTGLVTMQDVRRTNRHAWGTLRATDIASPITDVATAAPDEMLPALLERVAGARAGDGRALVFDGARLVGIVSSTDLRRAMEAAALHRPPLAHG